MKMSKLILMALLATGTVFAFTGCGDKKDDKSEKKEAKAEQKASDPAKELVDKFIKGIKDKDLKAVQSYLPEDNQPKSVDDLKEAEAIFSLFKYEKTVKVNDKYSLVCGTMTMKVGDAQETIKVAFHVKDGKIVDMNNGWEPKAEKKASDPATEVVDKLLKGLKDKDLKAVQSCISEDDDKPESVDDLKEAEAIFSSFKYEKTVKVNDKYSLVCGTITDPEEGNTKFAFHVKNGKIVDGEDNWEPKDKHK